jgi:general secretion pathway protein F/type IV pilus assembly protein PilC
MMLVDMVAVGEQTGTLGKSLEKAAARYDKELDKRIKRMTAMISPVIILFMAVIVGVVAYSIISAVFQSVNGIRSRV